MDSEGHASSSETVRARIVFSDLVPDGRCMVEVEKRDETIYCVRPGEMSPELAEEWNRHLEHATRSGRWTRTETGEKPGGHPPVW